MPKKRPNPKGPLSDLERPPRNQFTKNPTWLVLIRLLVVVVVVLAEAVTKEAVEVVLTELEVMIELANQTSEEVPEHSIIVTDIVHREQETTETEKIALQAVPVEEDDLQTIADLTILEEIMIHVAAAAVEKTVIREKAAAVMAQDQVLEDKASTMKCYELKNSKCILILVKLNSVVLMSYTQLESYSMIS